MLNFKKCVFVEDLLGITFFSVLGVIFILVPPFNETFLRIPFSLSLFFFIPGYAFIATIFPGKTEISGSERFTLSVSFSIILTVFDGLLISMLPWGYRPSSITISILGITTFFSIIAIFSRKLLNESEQFSFSINELIKSIRSEELDETNNILEKVPAFVERKRFHRSRSKAKVKGLISHPYAEVKKMPIPPEIEKGLIISLIISIILVSGMQVYAKVTQEEEAFTELYLLGSEGKAEGYPTESLINIPITVTVGIENHELHDVNYILQMKADGVVIKELRIPIENDGTWIDNLTYTRQEWKNGKSKLEFSLFKEELGYFPYRSVHLYIQNNNSLNSFHEEMYSNIDLLPKIQNGDMESNNSWKFNSNSEIIMGSYVKNSGVNSSFAYGIVNSYNGSTYDNSVSFGEISQSIECKENITAVISAFVMDDFNLSTQITDTQFKQVTFNGKVVWSDSISGNEGWQHLEIPVSLRAGSNNLTFGLKQVSGEIIPVTVLWDNFSLIPISNISPYVSDNSTVETIPPTSKVMELPAYTNSKTFTVSWNGTDEGSGIDYYSIESSTDGVNWETWISNTKNNSSNFTGESSQTYYFRSIAVDRAGNKEPEHTDFDARTIVYTETPKVMLDITPNPCKTATTFTVAYPVPLKAVICLVTPDGFEPESIELAPSDGVNWTSNYIVTAGNRFYVEAICTDIFGNTAYAFDEFQVDNSVPDLKIEVTPETIDVGYLEIKVIPSTTLKSKPSVSVSGTPSVDVTYLSYSDGAYSYEARIKSELNEGGHKVSVTGYDLNSKKITGNTTFLVDHSG